MIIEHNGKRSVNAEVAHIYPAGTGGPRSGSTPNGTVDLHHESNLLLLCGSHHKQVDDHPDEFPAEMLRAWKLMAEAADDGVLISDSDAASFAARLDSRTSALDWARPSLQQTREQLGLTVSELADRCQLDAELIHRLESGTAHPTRAALRSLLKALALDPHVPDSELLEFVCLPPTSAAEVEHLIRSLALHFASIPDDSKFWTAVNVANTLAQESSYAYEKLRFASNLWLSGHRSSSRPGELAFYVLALIDPAVPELAAALGDAIGPPGFATTHAVGRRWLEEVFDLAWAVYSADMRKPGLETLAAEAAASWGTNAEELAALADHPNPLFRKLVATNRHASVALLLQLTLDDEADVRTAAATWVPDPHWCRREAGNADAALRRGVAANAETPAELLDRLACDDDPEVRAAVARNKSNLRDTLARLGADPDVSVRFDARETLRDLDKARNRAGAPAKSGTTEQVDPETSEPMSSTPASGIRRFLRHVAGRG